MSPCILGISKFKFLLAQTHILIQGLLKTAWPAGSRGKRAAAAAAKDTQVGRATALIARPARRGAINSSLGKVGGTTIQQRSHGLAPFERAERRRRSAVSPPLASQLIHMVIERSYRMWSWPRSLC